MDIKKLIEEINEDFFLLNKPTAVNLWAQTQEIEPIVLETRWIGFPPATDSLIQQTEEKFQLALPPSYKTFLSHTNGFRNICPYMEHLLPIEKIDWLIDTDSEWVALMQGQGDGCIPVEDDDYFTYGKDQDDFAFRPRHFRKSIKVSTMYDNGVVMLNPEVRFNAEWEVIWVSYASTFNATRYQSFYEFLEDIHQLNDDLIKTPF